jgi:hypothetical protein
MSLMNYFTIGYQIEKENSRISYLNKYQRGNLQSEGPIKNNLSQSIVENLIKFGFNLDQIMTAHKIYKFKNLDEAIFVMMKDNETGKFNHRYIKKENQNISNKSESNGNNNIIHLDINDINKNVYLNLKETCFICNELSNEHVDYDFKEIKLVLDLDNDKNNKNNDNNNNKNNKNYKNYKNYKNRNDIDISQNNQYDSNCKINLDKENISKNLFIDINNNYINNNNKIEIDISKNNDNYNDNDDNINNINKIEENNSKLNNDEGEENIKNDKNKKDNVYDVDFTKQINSNILDNTRNNNNKKKLLMRSEIIINIDKETLLSFEDPDICTICFNNKLIGKNFIEFSCGHKFCKTCIKSYLTTNIINGNVKL